MDWFTDTSVGDVPNWTFVAVSSVVSSVSCMFMLVLLIR
jgi:hypothetical protein